MKNQKKLMIAGLLVVVSIVMAIILAENISTGNMIYESSDNEIVIGFIGPLTGFGAVWGLEQQNAIEMALDEINMEGKKLKMIYEDTKCDGKEAVNAAQKLINIDNVKILITVCSSETLAVAPIAEENKVLVLGVWPTNTAISSAGDYIFRISYSDKDTSNMIAETLDKYNRVGILSEQTDYAIGLKNGFKRDYEGLIIEEDYASGSKDVRTQIMKILSQNPEAIFINPDSPSTGLEVLEQLHNLKFDGDVYGNFFGGSSSVINSKYSNGMIFFADPIPNGNIKEELFSKYNELFGRKPDFEFAVAAQYDAMFILDKAINECGDNSDCLRDYLYDLDTFSGALGTYHFDSNGDVVGLVPSIKRIVNNKVIEIN